MSKNITTGNANKSTLTLISLFVATFAIGVLVGYVISNKYVNQQNNPDTIIVQESSISYEGVEGKNALELLKQNYAVETNVIEGRGEVVVSIDGQKADEVSEWNYYVNEELGTVPAADYVTKTGDIIVWSLDSSVSVDQ